MEEKKKKEEKIIKTMTKGQREGSAQRQQTLVGGNEHK